MLQQRVQRRPVLRLRQPLQRALRLGRARMLRLQEQMAAQNQIGNIAGQARGQDLGFAGMGMQNNQFNAGQQNQSNQFGN